MAKACIAVIGAGLMGRTMLKLSAVHTAMAAASDSSISSQPGMPTSLSTETTVQLVSAPTISTSPWAKLIRLMMPYTIV